MQVGGVTMLLCGHLTVTSWLLLLLGGAQVSRVVCLPASAVSSGDRYREPELQRALVGDRPRRPERTLAGHDINSLRPTNNVRIVRNHSRLNYS